MQQFIKTRGSQEPVIAHLVFNLTSKVDRKWGVLHIILKMGHPKIISTKISEQKIFMWFLSHNIPKWNKLVEKISQKNPEYMLNYSLPYSCSLNLSSFWFVIKWKLTTKKISIFSNSSHFEWRAGLSDTILKGDHPRTIPAKFVLIRFSGFRGEDLNVIFYQNRSNLHNRYKSAGRKISQKNPEYMWNYSLPCSCS